jgi:hypothetical protein
VGRKFNAGILPQHLQRIVEAARGELSRDAAVLEDALEDRARRRAARRQPRPEKVSGGAERHVALDVALADDPDRAPGPVVVLHRGGHRLRTAQTPTEEERQCSAVAEPEPRVAAGGDEARHLLVGDDLAGREPLAPHALDRHRARQTVRRRRIPSNRR